MLRRLLASIAALATSGIVQLLLGALLSDAVPGLVPWLIGVLAGLQVGRSLWHAAPTVDAGARATMLRGAFIVGGIGFAAGFFGPMILAPQANQGPMLGIFITGPLGFIAGGIAGLICWRMRGREA
jgi:hypothetical protein